MCIVTSYQCAVENRAGAAGPAIGPGGMESPQMYDAAAAPPPPPQPDLKKAAEDKRTPFPPPDLDELNGQEISLDLQHLIEDQFRGEETMALFQEILPGGRSPQQRPFARTTLAYMPQPVHSGASYAAPVQSNSHEQAPPIKEEPPEPHDFRRSVTCAQYTGQYNPQPPVGVSGPYGGGFTPLPPLGAPLLPPLLKHKPAPPRRSSGKVIDKGTDEYRRRRERNNIAVRKSREKAKVRSREVEEKVKTLLREKEALLKRLEAVSGELSLHKQMYVHLINLNHPEITELCRSMLQLGAPHGPDHSL
ncbi:CCAAT/enhancer-binding protein [Papilio machaon]|uniref:CCAAT/enhancer-binding protein n=1 Tax=Papilio machaon TaxID=76193 RepID=A0A0N1PJV0_PAPMA|nr:CCAAT/enhancer-binding protein [Papilio machaon]KPJ19744.1 CCAAT/enhancer-binding protein [Papilio machaon]